MVITGVFSSTFVSESVVHTFPLCFTLAYGLAAPQLLLELCCRAVDMVLAILLCLPRCLFDWLNFTTES